MVGHSIAVLPLGLGFTHQTFFGALNYLETRRTHLPSEFQIGRGDLQFARAFCFCVCKSYWKSLQQKRVKSRYSGEAVALRMLPQEIVATSITNEAVRIATNFGDTLSDKDVESAIYAIGRIYMQLVPEDYRSKNGIFYTPPALAARLIDRATQMGVDWTRCQVLDPACGGGAFLAPVAKKILTALPDCKPEILVQNVINRVRGFELDPFAAWLSQVTLDALLMDVCRAANQRLPWVVEICDSIQRDVSDANFDLVIGNPPYGKVSLSPTERKRYGRSLYGHANLYGIFTDIALRHARSNGVIAYVTPTSFLAGEYFKNLRALLENKAPPATIDFVTSRKGVFDDVLQETLLVTFRRNFPARSVSVATVTTSRTGRLRATKVGSLPLPKDSSQPWIIPRSRDSVALARRLAWMPHRLSDWGYSVSTGPLVWNRHKTQLRRANGGAELPLIWAEAVTQDGRFVHRAEKKNHVPYFLPLEGDEWLVTRQSCVLLQRTTAKEQARRLIAAILPESFVSRHNGVIIENHLNMLRPSTSKPTVPLAVLAAFMNSKVADEAFRCVSGSVAVSAYELEALPLPPPSALVSVANLVKRGASTGRIDEACAKLFGILRL